MNKKCIIISAAPVIDMERLKREVTEPNCLIICADNGYSHAINAGIKPDILVGDFDSIENLPCNENVKIITLPSKKDDTDTLFAIKIGLEKGCKDFRLYGCVGGRTDHSIANISLLYFINENGAKGSIIDPICDIELVLCGTHQIHGNIDDTISFLSFGKPAKGVTLFGFEYPLNNATVDITFPIGISNRLKSKDASIQIIEGDLLLFRPKII